MGKVPSKALRGDSKCARPPTRRSCVWQRSRKVRSFHSARRKVEFGLLGDTQVLIQLEGALEGEATGSAGQTAFYSPREPGFIPRLEWLGPCLPWQKELSGCPGQRH